MMSKVLLCADELSLRSPELIGLEGERLEGHPWLLLSSDGALAREMVRAGGGLEEVWVVSCEQVEPINLAAALKHDAPGLQVCLVCASGTGSVRSRAAAARIDRVLDMKGFIDRYARAKAEWGKGDALASVAKSRERAASGIAPRVSGTPAPRKPGYVVTVAGGRGGVGKSSLVALLALVSQKLGLRTAVFDADHQFGDMDALLGKEACLRSNECVEDPLKLESLCEEDGVVLLGAPDRLEQGELVAMHLDELMPWLRGHFDVVAVNAGAGWDEGMLRLFEESGNVLFLVDQRPASITALKRGLQLCSRCGIASSPFAFAINRCQKGSALTSVDAACALGGVKVLELDDGGDEVEQACSMGVPETLLDAHNAYACSAARLFLEIFPGSDELDRSAIQELIVQPKRGIFGKRGSKKDRAS